MWLESWLWALFTVAAALAQTLRNAMQRELTGSLGTASATYVRFLFGFPFAVVLLAAITAATGESLSLPPLAYLPWIVTASTAQVLATALMLSAMGERSFVVTIAYIKTEPVQVALFGLVFLGDKLTAPMMSAILIATIGVMMMSLKSVNIAASFRPTLLGIAAGTMFALSAVTFRGAILSLEMPNFVMAATITLTAGLALQAGVLSIYLAWRDREALAAIFREWRPSIFAGFMGALASEFWCLAFALATAASVRTLALVEVLFAQAISHFMFRQPVSPREAVGIALVVAGVALLLAFH